jgi:hypothetical protein
MGSQSTTESRCADKPKAISSSCFRLERLPGRTCTHWKAPPCHGAHRTCTLRACSVGKMGYNTLESKKARAPGLIRRREGERRTMTA